MRAVRGTFPGMFGVLTGMMGGRALCRGAGEEVPVGCDEITVDRRRDWLVTVAPFDDHLMFSRY